jgi:hypothetical protein
MVTRTVSLGGIEAPEVRSRVAAAIESTPDDAVVRLSVVGTMPTTLNAAMLRSLAGARTVTLSLRPVDLAH